MDYTLSEYVTGNSTVGECYHTVMMLRHVVLL